MVSVPCAPGGGGGKGVERGGGRNHMIFLISAVKGRGVERGVMNRQALSWIFTLLLQYLLGFLFRLSPVLLGDLSR
jgi:hypothetical protein